MRYTGAMVAEPSIKRRSARLVQASILFVAAALLAAATMPRLLPNLRQFAADSTLAAVYRGERPSSGELEHARRHLEASVAGAVQIDPARELADVTLMLDVNRARDPAARVRLEQLESVLETALRDSPADSYVMTRLAHVRLLLGRPPQTIAAAAVTAMQIAPHTRGLVIRRLDLALRGWSVLTQPQLEVIYEQVRFAYIDLNLRNEIVDLSKRTATAGFISTALTGRTIYDGSDAQDDFFRLLRR